MLTTCLIVVPNLQAYHICEFEKQTSRKHFLVFQDGEKEKFELKPYTHRDNGGSLADFVRGIPLPRRLDMLRRRATKTPLTKSATERPIVPVCKVETSYCFVT